MMLPALSSRLNSLRLAIKADNADSDQPVDHILHPQAGKDDCGNARGHHGNLSTQSVFGYYSQSQYDAAGDFEGCSGDVEIGQDLRPAQREE